MKFLTEGLTVLQEGEHRWTVPNWRHVAQLALDESRRSEKACPDNFDDPEEQLLVTGCLHSSAFELCGYKWVLRMYPRKVGSVEVIRAVYLILMPVDHFPPGPHDVTERINDILKFHTQLVAAIISEDGRPAVWTARDHRFDVSFDRFCTMGWDIRRLGDKDLLDSNGSLTFYVRIRKVEDPMGLIWPNFIRFDPAKGIGFNGLHQGKLRYFSSIVQLLFLTKVFRKNIYQIVDEAALVCVLQHLFYQLQTAKHGWISAEEMADDLASLLDTTKEDVVHMETRDFVPKLLHAVGSGLFENRSVDIQCNDELNPNIASDSAVLLYHLNRFTVDPQYDELAKDGRRFAFPRKISFAVTEYILYGILAHSSFPTGGRYSLIFHDPRDADNPWWYQLDGSTIRLHETVAVEGCFGDGSDLSLCAIMLAYVRSDAIVDVFCDVEIPQHVCRIVGERTDIRAASIQTILTTFELIVLTDDTLRRNEGFGLFDAAALPLSFFLAQIDDTVTTFKANVIAKLLPKAPAISLWKVNRIACRIQHALPKDVDDKQLRSFLSKQAEHPIFYACSDPKTKGIMIVVKTVEACVPTPLLPSGLRLKFHQTLLVKAKDSLNQLLEQFGDSAYREEEGPTLIPLDTTPCATVKTSGLTTGDIIVFCDKQFSVEALCSDLCSIVAVRIRPIARTKAAPTSIRCSLKMNGQQLIDAVSAILADFIMFPVDPLSDSPLMDHCITPEIGSFGDFLRACDCFSDDTIELAYK